MSNRTMVPVGFQVVYNAIIDVNTSLPEVINRRYREHKPKEWAAFSRWLEGRIDVDICAPDTRYARFKIAVLCINNKLSRTGG